MQERTPQPLGGRPTGLQRALLAFAVRNPARRNALVLLSSVLCGAALALSVLDSVPHSAAGGLVWLALALVAGAVAHLVLKRLLLPLWQTHDALARLVALALALAAGLAAAAQPTIEPQTLAWRWDVGPERGRPAPVSTAESWGVAVPQAVELHASDDPARTPFGVWRAEAELAALVQGRPTRLRFLVTQPDWTVLDQASGQVAPAIDGVIVRFSEVGPAGQRVVGSVDLNPHDPADQRWRTIDLDIAADAERLIVSVEPKGTIDSDRLLLSSGELLGWPIWLLRTGDVLAAAYGGLVLGAALALASRSASVARARQAIEPVFARFGWLISGALCLSLGYLAIWDRGPLLDDYTLKQLAVDPVTGQPVPLYYPSGNPNFPARQLTWLLLPRLAALLPDHVFLARLIMATAVGLNALLLGWLVTRLLGSRLAGIVAGWLFLAPAYTDVPFWIGAGAYLVVTSLWLLSLHAAWSLFTTRPRWLTWAGLAVFAFAMSFFFAENNVSLLLVLPALWLVSRTRPGALELRSSLARLAGVGAAMAVAFGGIYLALYTHSAVIQKRQGINIAPSHLAERIGVYLNALSFWTLDRSWGVAIIADVLDLGQQAIRARPHAAVLAALALACLVITIGVWRQETPRADCSRRAGLAVALVGAGWAVSTLLLPYVLAESQIFERRYLYMPTAGLAVALGAGAWLAARPFRHRVAQELVLGATAALLVLTTIATAGWSTLYAERARHDSRQLRALSDTVPSSALPEGATLVAYQSDEALLPGERLADKIIVGQFEAPAPALYGIHSAFRRSDLWVVVANRWGALRFAYDPARDSSLLTVQNNVIPIDRLLLYQFRDNTIFVITHMTITGADGASSTISFPIAQSLAASGSPSIPTIAVANETHQ